MNCDFTKETLCFELASLVRHAFRAHVVLPELSNSLSPRASFSYSEFSPCKCLDS